MRGRAKGPQASGNLFGHQGNLHGVAFQIFHHAAHNGAAHTLRHAVSLTAAVRGSAEKGTFLHFSPSGKSWAGRSVWQDSFSGYMRKAFCTLEKESVACRNASINICYRISCNFSFRTVGQTVFGIRFSDNH